MSRAPGRSFASMTLAVTAISFAARGVGFVVPIAVATWFGVSSQTDALFFAYALAVFVSSVLAPVLENLSVPFIAQRRERGDAPAPLVTALALVALCGAGVTSALLAGLSVPLLPYVTAFSPTSLALASRLLLAVTPLVALTALSSVFAGALNASGRFYFTAASPLARAAVNLLVIWSLKSSLGVTAVIYGYVAGEAVRGIVLLAACVRFRLVSHRVRSEGVGGDVVEFLRVAAFQALGMVSIGLVPLIDRTMASWLGQGSVSLLEYSDRLYQIPVALLGTGLVVTSLSRWSGLLYAEGTSALQADVKLIVTRVVKLSIGLSAGFAIGSPLLVKLAYGASLSDAESLLVVSTLLAYLLGVAPFVVGQLYNRALLALKQTRFLLVVTIVANVLNAVFNLLMMRVFGIAGLALSSSVTALVVVFVLRHRFASVALRATVLATAAPATGEAV